MLSPEQTKLRKALAYPAVIGALLAGGLFADNKEAQATASSDTATPKELIFSSNRNGRYQIYLKNLVTMKTPVNLSQSKSNDMNPQTSPDDGSVVFYSDRSGNNQIYEMDINHPKLKAKQLPPKSPLNAAENYDPVYMPDGQILFKSDLEGDKGLGDIWIMDRDGSNARNLTPQTPHTEEWKPEPISDSEIVYTSSKGSARDNPTTNELYVLDMKTGAKKRLTNNQVADWFPSYNPANNKVAFISNAKPGAKDDIYLMSEDGSGRKNLTKKLSGDSDDPSWSPDGKSITFLNKGKKGYDIYVMDKDGGNVKPLDISLAGDNLSPSFVTRK